MSLHRTDRPVVRLGVAFLPALFVLALGAAPPGAIPEDFYPAVSAPAEAEPAVEPAPGPRQARPCFLVRANWNEVLDRPQPVC